MDPVTSSGRAEQCAPYNLERLFDDAIDALQRLVAGTLEPSECRGFFDGAIREICRGQSTIPGLFRPERRGCIPERAAYHCVVPLRLFGLNVTTHPRYFDDEHELLHACGELHLRAHQMHQEVRAQLRELDSSHPRYHTLLSLMSRLSALRLRLNRQSGGDESITQRLRDLRPELPFSPDLTLRTQGDPRRVVVRRHSELFRQIDDVVPEGFRHDLSATHLSYPCLLLRVYASANEESRAAILRDAQRVLDLYLAVRENIEHGVENVTLHEIAAERAEWEAYVESHQSYTARFSRYFAYARRELDSIQSSLTPPQPQQQVQPQPHSNGGAFGLDFFCRLEDAYHDDDNEDEPEDAVGDDEPEDAPDAVGDDDEPEDEEFDFHLAF